jgi:predicted PurR-regulated permease PerM
MKKKPLHHRIKEHLFVKSSILTVSIIFFLCLLVIVLIIRYNRLSYQFTDLEKTSPSRVMADSSVNENEPQKIFIKVGGTDEIKILREQINELENLKKLIDSSN